MLEIILRRSKVQARIGEGSRTDERNELEGSGFTRGDDFLPAQKQ